MTYTIETQTNGEFTANLFHDDDSESPREWEAESVMFGFHRSYASPDPAPHSDPERARAIANSRENICLPVWLYAHGSTCYATGESNPFHCPWDSGLFGFIYISRADARARFGVKRLTAATVERVKKSLAAEVQAYTQWANGETYRWSVEDEDGDTLESCGGYYSQDEAWEEAKMTLTSFAQPESELAA